MDTLLPYTTLFRSGMARRLQRQDGPPVIALVGEDGDPRALREAARPMADRHQREPAVRLQPLHRGAERIEMGDDGAVGALAPARQLRADRTAPRQLVLAAEPFPLLGDQPDALVGVSRPARRFS